MAMLVTQSTWWPARVALHSPVAMSHTLIVLSSDPDKMKVLLAVTLFTALLWPWSVLSSGAHVSRFVSSNAWGFMGSALACLLTMDSLGASQANCRAACG
eukprot:CAMPEP_0202344300 /NCGR_PEP_ID=MMETSP1126-20121109/4052_1 /ASSEMBLY_ACC=CAM_ASM_000457 /TAXON_ID=3047 /ORGANISM="Dunaliella tertiolecta, Strain CCMP1320" /LENGTH=99 /DNA_ID=CAMNT_0048935493 /DNA_START=2720 /DNA_END=3019 /DNA_ORIENTATION=-